MKFKTWEKVYWGVISVLFLLSVVFAFMQKGVILVNVGGEQKLFSKGAFIGYSLLGYLIIFTPIWGIVRWIVNRGDKRERESGEWVRKN